MTACNETQSRCVCILPSGHETPHVCDCGGTFDHRGDNLYVWHLPPATNTYDPITVEEALERANAAARETPLMIEEGLARTPPSHDIVFRAPRGGITFFEPTDGVISG